MGHNIHTHNNLRVKKLCVDQIYAFDGSPFALDPNLANLRTESGPVYNDRKTIFDIYTEGSPTGGTFTITYNGVESDELAWNVAEQDWIDAVTALLPPGTKIIDIGASEPVAGEWNAYVHYIEPYPSPMLGFAIGSQDLTGGTDPQYIEDLTIGARGNYPGDPVGKTRQVLTGANPGLYVQVGVDAEGVIRPYWRFYPLEAADEVS